METGPCRKAGVAWGAISISRRARVKVKSNRQHSRRNPACEPPWPSAIEDPVRGHNSPAPVLARERPSTTIGGMPDPTPADVAPPLPGPFYSSWGPSRDTPGSRSPAAAAGASGCAGIGGRGPRARRGAIKSSRTSRAPIRYAMIGRRASPPSSGARRPDEVVPAYRILVPRAPLLVPEDLPRRWEASPLRAPRRPGAVAFLQVRVRGGACPCRRPVPTAAAVTSSGRPAHLR